MAEFDFIDGKAIKKEEFDSEIIADSEKEVRKMQKEREEEFDLSEEIEEFSLSKWISVDKVKKFIRRRRDDLHAVNNRSMTLAEALAKLKKEAGEKLIK